MSRRGLSLLLLTLLAASPVSAKRFGGGGSHGIHSGGHTTGTPHADAPHTGGSPSLTVRPHINGDSDEQEEPYPQSSAAIGASGSSGINGGYLMLGLAGPLLFIIFRLRKFFRLRNNKDEREAEFAQQMLHQHGRTPQAGDASPPPMARPTPAAAPVAAVPRMADGSDIDAFIRQARASFLHLRTLNQAMNGEEIRNYLSPALVEKLRPSLPKNAEAVKFPILKAELLESSQDGDGIFARLRFFGTVKLSASAPVFEFAEVWALRKASAIDNWQVVDIIRDDKPGA